MLIMKRIIAAASLALAVAVSVAACSAGASGPVQGSSTPAAKAEASAPASATPAPAQLGTRENPFPVNTPGQYDATSMWTVTVTGTNSDAWSAIHGKNEFNDPPPDGYADVLGNVTVAAGSSTAAEGADPGLSLAVNYVGSDGNSYDSINHPCGADLPGTSLQDAGTMFANANRAVVVCAQVPVTAVAGGTWSVAYSGDPSSIAFFAGAK